MKFKDRNGVIWQDIVICPTCRFKSDDLNLMTCPNDGRVLAETSVIV